jgi:protein-S-isoprenylcysteine O-methyltransferase Ste14
MRLISAPINCLIIYNSWEIKEKMKTLIGSGDKISLFALPFAIIGLVFNVMSPLLFNVGGPTRILRTISLIILILGLINWAWCVVLILAKVPKKELITSGPFLLVKHPLYTGVALLVFPWLGFLLNTWLGLMIGIVVYAGSKIFAPGEDEILSDTFGREWDEYCKKVWLPWL